MSELLADPWGVVPEPKAAAVPQRYRGVWQRTLLQTPEHLDECTWVRWMQLGRWHADLRVPPAARQGRDAPALQLQQGFAGITQVETGVGGETCTWHRLVDYQPPGATPDAGHMSFETPERVVEIGVHGVYREVWERLPDSTGRSMALAEPVRSDGRPSARLFLSGRYLMRVRPTAMAWQPHFEISFGVLDDGRWRIQRSTRPELEGCDVPVRCERVGLDRARVRMDDASSQDWCILEWDEHTQVCAASV